MYTNDNAVPSIAPSEHRVSLLDIGPRRCRFIVSDTTRDAICCGAPTTSDLSSWCAHHTRVVFEPRLTAAEREQRRRAA